MSATAKQNGTALVRQPADIEAPITNGEIDTLYRLANALSQSRFFRDAAQAQQAFAKLLFGRDMGLSATQAMMDINIVEGKPEMSANLHAAKVRSSGIYDYRIVVLDDSQCEVEFGPVAAPGRDDAGRWLPWPTAFGVSRFTTEDAERAGLTKPRGNAPSNYVKYSRNMLFARAMTNGVAWFCPDVFNGIRVYAEGEIQAAAEHTSGNAPLTPPAQDEEAPGPDQQQAMVDALAKGVNLAGWDDARLSMELVGLGVIDAADPLDKLATLTDEQAEQLNQKLSDEVAAADAAEENGGDDGDD